MLTKNKLIIFVSVLLLILLLFLILTQQMFLTQDTSRYNICEDKYIDISYEELDLPISGHILNDKYSISHSRSIDNIIKHQLQLIKHKDYDGDVLSDVLITLYVLLNVKERYKEANEIALKLSKTQPLSSIGILGRVVFLVSNNKWDQANKVITDALTLLSKADVKIINKKLHTFSLVKVILDSFKNPDDSIVELNNLYKKKLISYTDYVFNAGMINEVSGNFTKSDKFYGDYLEYVSSKNIVDKRRIQIISDFYASNNMQKNAALLNSRYNINNSNRIYYNYYHSALHHNIWINELNYRISTTKDILSEVLLAEVISLNPSTEVNKIQLLSQWRYLGMINLLKPNWIATKIMLLDLVLKHEFYVDAIELSDKIYNSYDNQVVKFYSLLSKVKSYEQYGCFDTINKTLRQAIKENNNDLNIKHQAYSMLLSEAYQFAKFDIILDIKDDILAILKQDSSKINWYIYYMLAMALHQLDYWQEAKSFFTKAMEVSPANRMILDGFSHSLLERKQSLDKAKVMIDKSMSIAKTISNYNNIGWWHYLNGNYNTAFNYIQVALDVSPSNPEINDRLGDIYWRLEKKENAILQWKRALENYTNFSEFNSMLSQKNYDIKIKQLNDKIASGLND